MSMKRQNGFLQILQSVDAFFPIGAFTLSNGLEDYVIRERITCAEDLRTYLSGFLQIFPYNDLGILALAYQHAAEKEMLLALDDTAAALKAAQEVRVGSMRMCSRYLKARSAMEERHGMLEWYSNEVKQKHACGVHPVALGIYGAEEGIDLFTLLTMYGYSILSGIVNNTVKLVPLSQMEGQKLLFESLEMLEEAAEKAMNISMDELGANGGCYEIHCMLHEQLYSRQYMS